MIVVRYILAVSLLCVLACEPLELEVEPDGIGVICIEGLCGTVWRARDDLAVTAAHVIGGIPTRPDPPRRGDTILVYMWWMGADAGAWQEVEVRIADYDNDFAVLRWMESAWPETRYPLCESTPLGAEVTVASAVDSDEFVDYEPDLEISSGHVLARSDRRFIGSYHSEHGYSGAPVFAGGCVIGTNILHILTRTRQHGVAVRAERMRAYLDAAEQDGYIGPDRPSSTRPKEAI